jgi:CheY-like chemotaxis protein
MIAPILIVDDSAVTRSVLRKALELSGHPSDQIVEVTDGLEAFEWLSKNNALLVFTDLHMPRMTGIELIEKMTQDARMKSVRVVVISSDAGLQYRNRLCELGVQVVLRKPFRPEQIRAVLRMLSQPTQGTKEP